MSESSNLGHRNEGEIPLTSADGHRIRNRLIPGGGDHLLILAHGIATNKEEDGIYTRFVHEIVPDTFDSIRFDFRGHGESAMKPIEVTISGEILDLMAVYDWATRQNYKSTHLLATSFGASIALLTIRCFDLSSLNSMAMWNPVINYRNTFIESTVEWGREFFNQKSVNELARRRYTSVPDTTFTISPQMTVELLAFHPEDTGRTISIPFLIVHGGKDTMVPASDARRFSTTAKRQGKYVEIPGVDHGFEDKIELVYDVTRDWLVDQRERKRAQ